MRTSVFIKLYFIHSLYGLLWEGKRGHFSFQKYEVWTSGQNTAELSCYSYGAQLLTANRMGMKYTIQEFKCDIRCLLKRGWTFL